MYHDLNIPWPLAALEAARKRTASLDFQAEISAVSTHVHARARALDPSAAAPAAEKRAEATAADASQTGLSKNAAKKLKKKQEKQQATAAAAQRVQDETDAQAGPSSIRLPHLSPFNPTEGLTARQIEKMRAVAIDLSEREYFVMRDRDLANLLRLTVGYRTLAFNHIVHSRFEATLHQNPFYDARTKETRPPFPGLDPRKKAQERKRRKQVQKRAKDPVDDFWVEAADGEEVTQLSRCSIVLDELSMGKGGHGIVGIPIAEASGCL